MHVCASVTAVAIRRQLEIRRRLGLVTDFANDLFMSARKWIFGLPGMVETPSSPTVWIMAVRATRPKLCLVEVFVTLVASSRLILVSWRMVTLLAGHGSM